MVNFEVISIPNKMITVAHHSSNCNNIRLWLLTINSEWILKYDCHLTACCRLHLQFLSMIFYQHMTLCMDLQYGSPLTPPKKWLDSISKMLYNLNFEINHKPTYRICFFLSSIVWCIPTIHIARISTAIRQQKLTELALCRVASCRSTKHSERPLPLFQMLLRYRLILNKENCASIYTHNDKPKAGF